MNSYSNRIDPFAIELYAFVTSIWTDS